MWLKASCALENIKTFSCLYYSPWLFLLFIFILLHLLGFSSKPYCSFLWFMWKWVLLSSVLFLSNQKEQGKWMEGIKQKAFKKKQKINMQALRREVERTMNKQREKKRAKKETCCYLCCFAALHFCYVSFIPVLKFQFFVMMPIVMDQSSNPATFSFWVSPSIFPLCKVVIADSIQVFELFLFALDLFPHFLSLSNFSILTLHFLPS